MDKKRKNKSSYNVCKICNCICYTRHFQQDFKNWTSGNNDIDNFIQYTQLSAHNDVKKALEWIPYDRFYNIEYIEKDRYHASWNDGNIIDWDSKNKNWKREGQNMIIELKRLNDPKNIMLKSMDKTIIDNKFYGITQDPETKDYMMVLDGKCKKCNYSCYSIHFKQNFNSWTSDNDDINKFIQNTQLSSHDFYGLEKVLEWISYDKLYYITYIAENEYKANWIDGKIKDWDSKNKNWKRGQNIIVVLKKLNNAKDIKSLFINEIAIAYGITQNPETKDYMMVLSDKCKLCYYTCYSIYFQQNFNNWTSGNDEIDKFIQDIQLLSHKDVTKALEWIPYDKFYDIKYIAENKYKANWIEGNIIGRDSNWKRNQNTIVVLKKLNNLKNVKFMSKVSIAYGITQNPETKDYMIVLSNNDNNKCEKCNYACDSIHFLLNFNNWTSGNYDIDKFIQDTQLSSHKDDVKKALEWIPYNKLYNVEYIAKDGFGKVYKANWIDGNIIFWDNEYQNWKRIGQNMFVALKSLNNSKNITLEFMNEIALHNKVDNNSFIIKLYGITQDPDTKNYMMVLEYAENGSLRDFLKKNDKLDLKIKINYLYNIASGLENIHGNEIIHRDLHIGNILKNYETILITDMGLCKPADNSLENSKDNIYGVLSYVAPEVLRGQSYTKAADIYSFGIVMYEVISGISPYHDLINDDFLAAKICQGLRPRFNTIKVPPLIVRLIKRCLDANSLNRPTAIEVRDELWEFKYDNSIVLQVINDNNITLTSSSYKIHSKANYTGSSLLSFISLPEPKNSEDYYEQNDDIISIKFSDSLKYNFLNEHGKNNEFKDEEKSLE